MKENIKNIEIGGTVFSRQTPLIIAELGTSHNGSLNKAKSMIDAASDSGAACVKFQMVYADEILHPNTGEVPLPGGKIRLYDKFKALELEPDFYIELKNYVESKGLLFLCTPFGPKSASVLKKMSPKIVKIASPELNYTRLLEEIAAWELPTLLSTGVSTLSDIEKAVSIFMKNSTTNHTNHTNQHKQEEGENQKPSSSSVPPSNLRFAIRVNSSLNICLLHCVTSYPAPETDYNLRLIPYLASKFGLCAGVSDHSADPELVPALSVSMGAAAIEKHFCLSRNDPGLDDPIALEPADFSKMVKAVGRACAEEPDETILRLGREKGEAFIQQILGNGIKELAPSEKENYSRTNRSIHALRDIQKGEVLKKSDYACLRTEKILRPGLEPSWENQLEGKTVKNFIPAGEGIRMEDIF